MKSFSDDVCIYKILEKYILQEFKEDICLVSSFGIESGVLIHMVAQVDPNIDILFINTVKLFPETIAYKETLENHFQLKNVKTIMPDPADIMKYDSFDMLWQDDPDACCKIRKVKPFQQYIEPYKAWINGRKQYHGDKRKMLELVETVDGKTKINPLLGFTFSDSMAYLEKYKIPRHPLLEKGFYSVGCEVCTAKNSCEKNPRYGRWKGSSKTECGIHR